MSNFKPSIGASIILHSWIRWKPHFNWHSHNGFTSLTLGFLIVKIRLTYKKVYP